MSDLFQNTRHIFQNMSDIFFICSDPSENCRKQRPHKGQPNADKNNIALQTKQSDYIS